MGSSKQVFIVTYEAKYTFYRKIKAYIMEVSAIDAFNANVHGIIDAFTSMGGPKWEYEQVKRDSYDRYRATGRTVFEAGAGVTVSLESVDME